MGLQGSDVWEARMGHHGRVVALERVHVVLFVTTMYYVWLQPSRFGLRVGRILVATGAGGAWSADLDVCQGTNP